MTRREPSGFTLIELLVVIAIIAVLAAILFPVFAQAREKSRQATCSSNMRQITSAIVLYAEDNDAMWPLHQYPSGQSAYASLPPRPDRPWDLGNWVWATRPYLHSWSVLVCPSASKENGYGSAQNPVLYTNYTLNGFLHNRAEAIVEDAAGTFLLVEGVGDRALDGYGACFPVPFWHPPDPTVYEYMFYVRDGIGVNHHGGSNFAYVDGHVKWQPSPGRNGMLNTLPITADTDFNIRLFTPWID